MVVETRGVLLFRDCYALCYILSGMVYVLSPFDLLPEAVLGPVGLLDDFLTVGVVIFGVANQFLVHLREVNDN